MPFSKTAYLLIVTVLFATCTFAQSDFDALFDIASKRLISHIDSNDRAVSIGAYMGLMDTTGTVQAASVRGLFFALYRADVEIDEWYDLGKPENEGLTIEALQKPSKWSDKLLKENTKYIIFLSTTSDSSNVSIDLKLLNVTTGQLVSSFDSTFRRRNSTSGIYSKSMETSTESANSITKNLSNLFGKTKGMSNSMDIYYADERVSPMDSAQCMAAEGLTGFVCFENKTRMHLILYEINPGRIKPYINIPLDGRNCTSALAIVTPAGGRHGVCEYTFHFRTADKSYVQYAEIKLEAQSCSTKTICLYPGRMKFNRLQR